MMKATLIVLAAGAALTGCASVPEREAVETISAARASIEQAARIESDDARGDVMQAARKKLDAAEAALEAGDEARAVRLADEAQADAAYAVAATRASQSQQAVEQVEVAIETLRAETTRP